jgi:hypothetical protein
LNNPNEFFDQVLQFISRLYYKIGEYINNDNTNDFENNGRE